VTVPASGYLDRLAERSSRVGSVLCLGIDPDPAALPDGFPPTVQGIERFAQLILEAGGPAAAAIKPNLAFFEAFGSAGLAVLERLRARVPAALPVILDAKRGDIGSTSARHAAALFDALGADAITVNPYVGEAGLEPLLERADRFVYVLCRTSNPGAGELQNLVVGEAESAPGEPLWARVARRVAGWGPGETCGLVVGATAPTELAAIREIAPDLPFLVPGLGAQGGAIEAVLESGPATRPPAGDRVGGGLVVNVSRGIAGAAHDGAEGDRRDPAERIAAAAREWARRLPVLR
jgi:orotidine-5'-phosphate decarboxylase